MNEELGGGPGHIHVLAQVDPQRFDVADGSIPVMVQKTPQPVRKVQIQRQIALRIENQLCQRIVVEIVAGRFRMKEKTVFQCSFGL